MPDWPAEQLKGIRNQMKRGEGLIWVIQGESLQPLPVTIGFVGEKETEISGDGVEEGMAIAVPPKRGDSEHKRRFGLSLF